MIVGAVHHRSSPGATIVVGALALALGIGLFLQRRSTGGGARSRQPTALSTKLLGVASRALPLLFVVFGLVVIAIGIDHAS